MRTYMYIPTHREMYMTSSEFTNDGTTVAKVKFCKLLAIFDIHATLCLPFFSLPQWPPCSKWANVARYAQNQYVHLRVWVMASEMDFRRILSSTAPKCA